MTWWLLRAFALSIPFSIFVSQLLLVFTAAAAAIDWWTRGRPRLRTPLDLPIACFALSSLLAAFLGLHPLESLYGLRTYLQIVVIYLVYAYARAVDRSLSLVLCFLVGIAGDLRLHGPRSAVTVSAAAAFPRADDTVGTATLRCRPRAAASPPPSLSRSAAAICSRSLRGGAGPQSEAWRMARAPSRRS